MDRFTCLVVGCGFCAFVLVLCLFVSSQYFGPTFDSGVLCIAGESGVSHRGGGNPCVPAIVVSGFDDRFSAYEHLEYKPLVNARAHKLGAKRKIANVALRRQWTHLLWMLVHKSPADITSNDWLAVCYHLLAQDR